MDHTLIFARHFARLVWLLLHEPENTDEQKVALRAMVTVSKDGAVSLALRGEQLHTNVAPVPSALAGVVDVSSQMASHGLAMVMVDASAAAADMLGAARILAGVATPGDGGAAAEAKRLAFGTKTVRFVTRPRSSEASGSPPEMEFGEVLDDPLAEALKRATPRSTKAIIAQANAHTDGGSNSLFAQFAAPRAPNVSHDQLLQKLDAAVDVSAVTSLLDELTALAENAARDGKTTQVIDIMLGVLRREAEIQDVESRRAFTMAVRRLAKPTLLRAVALQLPHRPERRDELVSVLIRAGDAGADVLTELLEHSDDRVRRSASSALVRLGSGKAMQAIQDALKNPSSRMRMEAAAALVTRKHVRAAPTLLKALDVEKDEQVQAAFLLALGKLGTPDAVQRLLRAAEAERGVLKKTPVALRIAAVHGLTEARTPEALEALRALHDDKDPAVRDAVAVSLGRLP